MQERATQFSHSETGRIVSEYEPRLGEVLAHVAKDEARHYAFYRSVFEEILKRDPDQALHSASFILPAIDMPGITIPGFKELAEVIRRSGIYGPRDYLRIVQEQIRYWKIEKLQGLGELGRMAQEKILGIPARLKRIAEHHGNEEQGEDVQLRGRVQPRICDGMSGTGRWLALTLAVLAVGCGADKGSTPAPRASASELPTDRRDAEALGREVFELVDRAVDFRGSHRGRPAKSLRQMGIDSLTPATARVLVNVGLQPVVTVQYRKVAGREITSCRGDSQILEEAALSGGRFTLMCTSRSGLQRPVQVGTER